MSSSLHYLKVFRAVFFIAVFMSASSSYAIPKLPHFYEYLITTKDLFEGKPASVDLSSYPGAKKYRTKLRQGAQKGPNFAGPYTVVTYGCGTECQETWIVEAKTGKIVDKFSSALGLKYQLNSALMVVNPPAPEFIIDYK